MTALGSSYSARTFRFSMDVSSLMCLEDPCWGQPVGIWTCEKGRRVRHVSLGGFIKISHGSQKQMSSIGASKRKVEAEPEGPLSLRDQRRKRAAMEVLLV